MNKLFTFTIAIVLLVFTAGAALANNPIGEITAITGKATAKSEQGKKSALSKGSEIFLNDTINTKGGAQVQITMVDGTELSVGEKSSFTIDEYIYDPGTAENNAGHVKLFKGLFKVVTDQITKLNPDRFKVSTRDGVIGIRGCAVGFDLTKKHERVYIEDLHDVESVEILLNAIPDDPNALRQLSINTAGKGVILTDKGLTVFEFNPAQLNSLLGLLSAVLPTDEGSLDLGDDFGDDDPGSPEPGSGDFPGGGDFGDDGPGGDDFGDGDPGGDPDGQWIDLVGGDDDFDPDQFFNGEEFGDEFGDDFDDGFGDDGFFGDDDGFNDEFAEFLDEPDPDEFQDDLLPGEDPNAGGGTGGTDGGNTAGDPLATMGGLTGIMQPGVMVGAQNSAVGYWGWDMYEYETQFFDEFGNYDHSRFDYSPAFSGNFLGGTDVADIQAFGGGFLSGFNTMGAIAGVNWEYFTPDHDVMTGSVGININIPSVGTPTWNASLNLAGAMSALTLDFINGTIAPNGDLGFANINPATYSFTMGASTWTALPQAHYVFGGLTKDPAGPTMLMIYDVKGAVFQFGFVQGDALPVVDGVAGTDVY